MLVDDVILLPGILRDVVQFFVVNKSPFSPQHGTGPVEIPVLDHDLAVRQFVGLSLDKRHEAEPVEPGSLRFVNSAHLKQRRQDVRAMGQFVNIAGFVQPGRRPAQEEWYSMAAVVVFGLMPAHAGIENSVTARGPVIAHEDQDGVVPQAAFLEELLQAPHGGVELGDHAQELVALALVRIFLVHDQWNMRDVGGQVAEERSSAVLLLVHPFHGLVKPDIGTVPLVRLSYAVVFVYVIVVVVGPVIGHGGYPPCPMMDRLIEPAILRPVGMVVAEVPFSEMAGGIAAGSEDVGQGRYLASKH